MKENTDEEGVDEEENEIKEKESLLIHDQYPFHATKKKNEEENKESKKEEREKKEKEDHEEGRWE